MRSIILSLFAALFLSSCSLFNPGCLIQQQAGSLVSGVIVAQLQCSNVSQVQSDVNAAVAKLGLCPSGAQGPIADSVCPVVTALAVGFLANNVVPAAWGCSAANAKAALSNAVLMACEKLPY